VGDRRAPRTKRRISCEINVDGARHSGIVLDLSATGLFVQTNMKPRAGAIVVLGLSLPGEKEPVLMEARVARKKAVPPQLLTIARGGVGFAITKPAEEYLDFVAEMSPEHSEAVAMERAKIGVRAGSDGEGAQPSDRAGGRKGPGQKSEAAPKRFRIHVVEVSTGSKKTYLTTCATEQQASDQVLEQLGDEWKVLFIERV
jgi:hypothetical protein